MTPEERSQVESNIQALRIRMNKLSATLTRLQEDPDGSYYAPKLVIEATKNLQWANHLELDLPSEVWLGPLLDVLNLELDKLKMEIRGQLELLSKDQPRGGAVLSDYEMYLLTSIFLGLRVMGPQMGAVDNLIAKGLVVNDDQGSRVTLDGRQALIHHYGPIILMCVPL